MKFAILGFLVVVVIAFLVLVYKASKDWRWYQIVAVIFTMLLAITFMFPTANVLQSRQAWHKLKEELEVRAAESRRAVSASVASSIAGNPPGSGI